MSFEERIRQAVGRALDDVRTRVEQEMRALVQELAASAAEERQLAVAQAREQTWTEARSQADQRVAEAEAHLTATIDRVVADACAREREQAAIQARRAFEADVDRRTARLGDGLDRLDAAGSRREVLDALAAVVAGEAGRSAVFVVRGTAFQGWALAGFGRFDERPARFDIPLAQAPLVRLAVEARRAVTAAEALAGGPASDPAMPAVGGDSLAVPLVVGDRVAAIAYVDTLTPDGREAPAAPGWMPAVALLARHAARRLEALAAAAPEPVPAPVVPFEPAAAAIPADGTEASARRLARLLIEEICLRHEPSVDEGRRAGNLLARLGPQIARARRVYDARVPAALPSRARLFQQELVATLAGGDASRLGVSA